LTEVEALEFERGLAEVEVYEVLEFKWGLAEVEEVACCHNIS